MLINVDQKILLIAMLLFKDLYVSLCFVFGVNENLFANILASENLWHLKTMRDRSNFCY